ncbi:MAG: IS1634 family transposase [Tannerella sp.]|jgi:transposase|nr:IS1634 family transposase [Tannerella sp.]
MPEGRQIIHGREYVYKYISIWNKEKRRSEQKREYTGRMINGEFVPNKQYRLQQELLREQSERKHGQKPTADCKRLFAGAGYLFDKIGEKIGLTQDIKACFPQHYNEILSLAYYLALEPHSPLYRFNKWAITHEHPYGRAIPSQRSSELLSQIIEKPKMDFLKRQAKRRSEIEYLFYDSTSVSSYSEQLKQVKYGKNKDGDSLAQINLALLFGQKSGLPAYYRKLSGHITDVMTIGNLIAGVDYLDIKKVKLVMDRGFYSEKNLNDLMKKHYKFIIGAKVSLKFIQSQFSKDVYDFDRRERYNSDTGLFIKTQTIEWNYKETKARSGDVVNAKRRLYVHIYYNDQHATDDKIRFNKRLDEMEGDICKGNMKYEREKECLKYYEIKNTSARGISFMPKQEVIDKVRRNFGFFVLLSNGVKDPIEAIRIYRAKDMVEKAFNDLKDRLNMRRTSVSSEENLEGKLFIQFLSLIYVSYIKRAMEEAKLFKSKTMQELLDDLDIIEKFQMPGKEAFYGEITEKQRNIYTALGVTPPA